MSEDFLGEFLNQFAQAASERLAQKAADGIVDGLFNTTQNSRSIYKGKIEKIWLDQDVQENNRKGLLIHSKFQVSKLKDVKCCIGAYFYFKNETPLKDNNNSYSTVDGQVYTGKDFVPPYEETVYKDFRLFIPYDELHLAEGKHDLKFFIGLYERATNSWVARSNDYHFRHNYVDNQPRGDIKRIWVDFDTVEAGKLGMRIHSKFQVDNLKSVKCQSTVFFYSEDGKLLQDRNNSYCSTDGEVCVSDDFTPGYKNCIYEDFSLFIPYSEFHLFKGNHYLSFRIRLRNQAKKSDIVWSDNYYFMYVLLDKEYTISQDDLENTMSMLQVLVANQLKLDASAIEPESSFLEFFGTNFVNSTQFIKTIERNFNVKVNKSDPEEMNALKELNLFLEIAVYIVFKRKGLSFTLI